VSYGSSYAPNEPLDRLRMADPETIIAAVAGSRARARLRFRMLFVLTWLILVGGLVVGIMSTGRIDTQFLSEWGPFILGGIPITIVVSVCSIFFATMFAVVGALGRLARRSPIYAVATLYVSLVRGTPLIVQVFFVYSALPEFGIVLPAFIAGVFALSFNYGAYMTEIFRAGIQAIPRGQREAAQALGMTERDVMQRVVLPQAIRIVIPAIGNEFIAMIKDSALVSFVGLQELFWRARTTGTAHFQTFGTLMTAALVYWMLTIVFSLVQERLEKRMAESEVRL
jgi:polar amino acid transport system permease protein